MKWLDPLVYHLHRIGSGSWAHFSRAVDAFDASLNARSCARAMAEHAIVEFDFDHGRDWSVTSAQLIDTDSYGTVAWGGTQRSLAACGEIELENGTRSLLVDGTEYSYEHAIRVRRRGRAWPRALTPVNVNTILNVIPALPTVIGSRPLSDVPVRKAERLHVSTLERRNPGGVRSYRLSGAWEPCDGISVRHNATWKLDRATYVVSRNHRLFWAQPDIALWAGFVGTADRLGIENLVYYDDEAHTLLLARFPWLPVPYVRALLLCGARELPSERRDKRLFRNVAPQTATWLLNQLGIS